MFTREEALEIRQKLRTAIQKAFERQANASFGRLGKAADEIGALRQQLQQYAAGTPPPADLLLMAFLAWNVKVHINNDRVRPDEPRSWEFSTRRSKSKVEKPPDAQLHLFQAWQELRTEDVEVRAVKKKGVGRFEIEIDFGFKKQA
jgi:hypothetical protein